MYRPVLDHSLLLPPTECQKHEGKQKEAKHVKKPYPHPQDKGVVVRR